MFNHFMSPCVRRVSLTIGLALSLLWLLGGVFNTTHAEARPNDLSHPLKPSATIPTVVATVTVGGAPFSVGVNPATNRIYVANSYSNTVSVIDGENNTVVATTSVGSYPYGVGVNPTTNHVYVANHDSNNVSVIDGSINTVVATATVGIQPGGVGINSATNHIYVANEGSGTVSVIDGANNTVVATATVGTQPVAVGVNPTTNRVYVANHDSNNVSVIDGANNTVIATATVGRYPWGVGVNPTTNRIYVANLDGDIVSVIDGANNTVVATATVGTWPVGVGVNPMTNRIYVANWYSDNVSTIDGKNNTVVATATVGTRPGGVGVNPATGRVYVANWGSSNVSVIQDATGSWYVAPPPLGNDANDCLSPATPCATIQHAIDVANDGDQIFIASGLYTQSTTLYKSVSLTGVSSDTTILHAVEGQRVLTVTGATISNSVVISGLTMIGGNVTGGGGSACPQNCGGALLINNLAQPILRSLVIAGNRADFGGGLYAENGLAVYDTTFINNGRITETSGGGGAFIQGDTHLSNVRFISNTSGSPGGGLFVWYGAAFITDTVFVQNKAYAYGGGLYKGYAPDQPIVLNNTTFVSNSAQIGGGAYVDDNNSMTIFDSRFEQNTSEEDSAGLYVKGNDWGAHLFLINTTVISNFVTNPGYMGYAAGVTHDGVGTVEAINCNFENNQGKSSDGGGLNGYRVNLTNTTFISNLAYMGGGLYVQTMASINGGRLERNTSTDQPGGGIAGFDVYLSGTIVISNVAPGGAGVFAGGNELALDHVRVENNRAVGYGSYDYDYGGGIWTRGRLIISDSQILSNTASKGGGVSIKGVGTGRSRIVNSILAGNNATENGAGIYINAPGQYELIHTTIVSSTFITQPAIAVLSGTLNLTNSIITNHAIGISNTGGTVYEDYNLFFGNLTNTIGVTNGGHSLIGDPRFVDPLHDDYHLQAGSAAIDHGVDADVTTDLDGNPRPIGAGFDIGAYESQFAAGNYTLTVAMAGTGSGVVSPTVGTHQYLYGDVVTLTATPLISSTFVGFSGDVVATAPQITLTMDADKSITATFMLKTFVITPTTGLNGSITPSTPQTMTYGASQTFTITPDIYYNIADVGVDGVSQGPIHSYAFNNITANHTIAATFARYEVTLTVKTDGTGSGIVSPTIGTYRHLAGDIITLTATASADSIFKGWYVLKFVVTTNPLTFTIQTDETITAVFLLKRNVYLPLVLR